jgi:hypothetical protein
MELYQLPEFLTHLAIHRTPTLWFREAIDSLWWTGDHQHHAHGVFGGGASAEGWGAFATRTNRGGFWRWLRSWRARPARRRPERRHGPADFARLDRYNAEGVKGLCDRARSGRKPRLSEDQLAKFDKIVETLP